jgi:sugar phosphate isomerase/epimerase
MKRREFLEASGLAAGAAMIGSSVQASVANDKQPESRQSFSPLKIKIGLYSITYGGIWYNGPALSFEELLKRAKDSGYDGIELDNKRPMGNPQDFDRSARDKMRNLIERNGLEIPCVAANNDFSSPVQEHREMQLLMVKETIRMASDLGAKIVRLFAAWYGVPIHNGLGTYDLVRGDFYTYERQFPYVTRIDRWNYVRECLKEVADFAGEHGVILVLQNHPPLINHWKDCYDMVTEVHSDHLKICLDLPMMTRYDKEWVEEAAKTVGNLQTHSHFGGEFIRDEKGKVQQKIYSARFGKPLPDYVHFLDLMGQIGYNGWFTYELCHPVLTATHEVAGLDYVHEQVQLAREFIHDILTGK